MTPNNATHAKTPHFGALKLGKQAPRHDPRTLKLGNYTAKLAPAPLVFDQTARATNFGMMLNDQLGDCTIAAVAHQQQLWTSQTAAEVTAPDAQVLAAYEAVGGYVPGNASTDNGCVMLEVLRYWKAHGMFGRPLGAYTSVNPTKRQEVMDAIYYFGGIYLGLALPLSAQTQSEWDVVQGPNAQAGSWGGHCVVGAEYSFPAATTASHIPRTITCITWGQRLTMTWSFFATYVDECYALLSPDWINAATGKCPEGFDLAALQRDLAALRGA
ncbi:MAG: hypothetical protein M3O02_11155 [Acidobacteriota bacterium]|nr:hypothetical protein [Acidobacteriota bacterium]